nr:T9SS type A sorting domain-containing protein [Bacteroidota bacterium]
VLGEEIVSGIVENNNQSQINLKKLNRGIYFIRIFDGRTFVTKKIICQ